MGSFDALPDVREQDAKGNVSEGEAMIFDGKNNVVLGLPAARWPSSGVDDLVVVDAGDAVLVCRRDRAQDVRKAVDELRRRGRDEML